MKAPRMSLLAAALVATAHAGLRTDIEYGTAAGESLKLDAYVPEGAGPFPAVILVHGGSWMGGDKSGGPQKGYMAPMHEPLQKAGFAWFSINYRLAPKHKYPACIEDVETAIRWVKAHAKEFHLDPQRIALSGESAGGHLVALAAVRMDDSTRLAAVVPFYGVFDMASMAAPGQTLTKAIAALFGRNAVDESLTPMLRESSPILHVKRGLPPMLLVHGDGDKTVPYAQSTNFLAKLREEGVPSELITIPGGPHGMLPWPPLMPDFSDRVVAWLVKTMKVESAGAK
jgi:alpha-L-fucosidase 2